MLCTLGTPRILFTRGYAATSNTLPTGVFHWFIHPAVPAVTSQQSRAPLAHWYSRHPMCGAQTHCHHDTMLDSTTVKVCHDGELHPMTTRPRHFYSVTIVYISLIIHRNITVWGTAYSSHIAFGTTTAWPQNSYCTACMPVPAYMLCTLGTPHILFTRGYAATSNNGPTVPKLHACPHKNCHQHKLTLGLLQVYSCTSSSKDLLSLL